MIERCRAVLRAFAGLELVEVRPAAGAVIHFRFGPGGDRLLICEGCDVELTPPGGEEPTTFARQAGGRFAKGEREQAIALARALVGRRVEAVHHTRAGRLRVDFADGGAIRFPTALLPQDWSVWHKAGDAVLHSYVPGETRDLVVFGPGDEPPLVRHVGLGGRWTADAGAAARARLVAGTITRVGDGLAALRSLPLSAVAIAALEFGRLDEDGEGELSLVLDQAGLAVGGCTVVEPWGRADEEAMAAAVAPLLGRRAVAVEHAEDGRLTLAFADGPALIVLPATQEFPVWSAIDGATRRAVHALWDRRLVEGPVDEEPRHALGAVLGSLGELEARAVRPVRPVVAPRRAAAATPRAIHPCAWILGSLIGKRLVVADDVDGSSKLRMGFWPPATLVSEHSDVIVDDGHGGRERFHLKDHGGLSDQEAALAAVQALRDAEVVGVRHGERNRLTVALSDGAAIVLRPARWWTHEWYLVHDASGAKLEAMAALARPSATVAGRLVLSGSAVPGGPWAIRGELGRATARTGDRALLGARRMPDAVMMLRTLAGLQVTVARELGLWFGEPSGDDDGLHLLLKLGWADLLVHEPGVEGPRLIAELDHEGRAAALARLVGVRVHEVRHAAPGLLRLRFADGHRLTLRPAVAGVPDWTAYLGVDGLQVAALPDGSLRPLLSAETSLFDARPFVYGSLGWLPPYGFKS